VSEVAEAKRLARLAVEARDVGLLQQAARVLRDVVSPALLAELEEAVARSVYAGGDSRAWEVLREILRS
jgi:hypothetical protein